MSKKKPLSKFPAIKENMKFSCEHCHKRERNQNNNCCSFCIRIGIPHTELTVKEIFDEYMRKRIIENPDQIGHYLDHMLGFEIKDYKD